MEFAQVKYSKNVEGNFDVQLIRNNTVVATITFPTEELAAEYVELKQKIKASTDALIAYVELKQKIKASTDALIAEVTANLSKAEKAVPVVETKATGFVEEVVQEVKSIETKLETKVEAAVNSIKARVEKQKPIDASARVGVQPDIDTSAKVGVQPDIDTSAKVVVPE